MAAILCEDAMTGDTDKYLRPQDLKELGDDSLPQDGYMGFSLGARSASPRISSDRSNTLNRSSFARDSMMIEEILAPTKDTHLAVTRECNSDALRRYSWAADTLDNANLVSSPIHSGFLVSFMVDARGGSMRGSRHNGMRIIIPPRKCTAPTRITCRLVRRHKLACPPPMVEGEGLASRLVEVGPAGAQFLGPVIVEIPHFGSMRGKERELIVLRSDNGETWKEHQYDCRTEDLNQVLNGMDEELDSAEELEKKRICRIITRDFPQYFAVVSRIKQESNHMGPEGGVLQSMCVPKVRASFPEGALTKRIRVGLQAQPVPDELVKKIVGTRATFSPIVTVEPRRRKFHKPITMTIPVPPPAGEGVANGYRGDSTPCLRLLCSITGGTSPAQWEDITGTTPLSFVTECVSFTTNVSARFWLADCHQIPETVGLATQLYRELICVPYLAKFVVFAKMNDPVESNLRCFCMTDDKVDKTLEQQENFEEVARSKDIEVLEGKPIHVDCYGNLAPLTKTGQQLVFNFYAFKENRLPFSVKIRDVSQEPCGRLSFLKEPKTTKGLPQTAVCNLNITLPALKKEMESDPDEEADKPERRHTFASLALRKRYSYLTEPATSPQSPCERTDLRMAIVADHLGLSWTELAREMNFSVDEINHIRLENPNSLTAQSFMLLKKWVRRDGKDATTDALTTVLAKVNRMDIVTLLEGPIFDYGNISGTRSFADDSVFLDQSDVYQSLQMELQSPTELSSESADLLWRDDILIEEPRVETGRSPCRPSDLALIHPHGPAANTVTEEEPPMDDCGAGSGEDISEAEDHDISHRSTSSEQQDSGSAVKETGEFSEQAQRVEDGGAGDWQQEMGTSYPLRAWALALGEGSDSGSEEEEEEISQGQLNSLMEDIKLEEGSEGEEVTEGRVKAVGGQVEQAEKDMSSIPGWCNEASSVNVEPATQGQSLSTDPSDQQESGKENSSDSVTSSSKGHAGKSKHNGERAELPSQAGSLRAGQEPASGVKGQDGRAGPGREEDTAASEHKVQDYTDESGLDEDRTVTTRVFRRRVILKGEEARNAPGDSVTEEQFTDEDGNIVIRKVIRKVIRRVVASDERDQDREGRSGHQTRAPEEGDRAEGVGAQRIDAEHGEGSHPKKREGRHGDKKVHS